MAGAGWDHGNRNEMQCIVPNLFLGPYSCASKGKLEQLLQHGITHIVCTYNQKELRFLRPKFNCFIYLCMEVDDKPCENILSKFSQVNDFIESSITDGGAVLVHGNVGMSRSATFVIAYIMSKYKLPYMDAMKLVREKRFCISPNVGFIQQLKEFEPICNANEYTNIDECLVNSKKRKQVLD